MRATLFTLALVAWPGPASAGLTLSMGAFDRPEGPLTHLEFPELSFGGATSATLALTPGEVGGPRAEPGLALILGIIPGFGLGHYFARSPQWTVWLVADIVIFVVWPGGFIFTDAGAYALAGLLVLAERIVEGIGAYQAAGGGPLLESDARPGALLAPAERALPVGARFAMLR